MKTKVDIKKLISKIKMDKKEEKPRGSMRIDIDYTKPNYRERDMRNDAMDMDAHGAKEFFGGGC